MAHCALICPNDAGDVLSVGPLGAEMIRRGHRVTMVTGGRAVPIADKLGLIQVYRALGGGWETYSIVSEPEWAEPKLAEPLPAQAELLPSPVERSAPR